MFVFALNLIMSDVALKTMPSTICKVSRVRFSLHVYTEWKSSAYIVYNPDWSLKNRLIRYMWLTVYRKKKSRVELDFPRIVSFPEKSHENFLKSFLLYIFFFSMEVKCAWNQFNADLLRRRPTETYFIIEIKYHRHPEYINLVESDPSFS